MSTTLQQAAVLVLLASTLALGLHAARLAPFPLLHPPEALLAGELPAVTIEEAAAQTERGEAVLLDARPAELYAYGHLPESLSWPLGQPLDPEVERRLRAAPAVIVYCDGRGCSAAEQQARQLVRLGLTRVAVLTAGWNGWLEAGRSIVLGATPP